MSRQHDRTLTIVLCIDDADDEKSIEVSVPSDKLTFSSFDEWLRSRCGLDKERRLIFKDGSNRDDDYLGTAKLFKVYSETIAKTTSKAKKDTVSNEKVQLKTPKPPDYNSYALALVLLVLILIFMEAFYPSTTPLAKLSAICSTLDKTIGDWLPNSLHLKSGTILDAFINTVAWGSTYLFVRRLLNPETFAVAIEKYSADAVFGGLAAGAAIIVKAVLNQMLVMK